MPVARGIDTAGKDAKTRNDVAPALGRGEYSLGRPHTLIAAGAVGEIELRQPRMERNHYRLRLQRDGVADDVVAGREVEHGVRVDGLADGVGVVRLPVTLHAQCADADPVTHLRKRPDRPGRAVPAMFASGAAS